MLHSPTAVHLGGEDERSAFSVQLCHFLFPVVRQALVRTIESTADTRLLGSGIMIMFKDFP